MLLTIVVYIYTVFAFNFFRKFYVSEEDGEVIKKCHNMLTVKILFQFNRQNVSSNTNVETEKLYSSFSVFHIPSVQRCKSGRWYR